MLQAKTPERVLELMEKSKKDGAEAYGMQFCKMLSEYKNERVYKKLFEAAYPLPVYVTNYRTLRNEGKTDEELSQELLELADCGATLCDVMGDCFAPCKGEFTTDPVAVEKQKKLIEELHDRGAEVLMSSHVLEFTPAERVLEIALGHQSRGADICKIVTGASTRAEEIENLRIIDMLKQNLKIPFLFLSGGECYIMRRIGGLLGCCMSLCVAEHDDNSTLSQPVLSELKAIHSLLREH